MPFRFYFRVLSTLLLAVLAAWLCVALRTPLPWLIGPMLATAIASMLGLHTESSTPLRNGGQAIIGTAVGLYFTPAMAALVAGLWWAIGLGVVLALGLGWLFGAALHRWHAQRTPGLSRATTYFSSAIGGASEMTHLAERFHGRADLVASAHSVRLMLVTLVVPFAMQYSGWHGQDSLAPAGAREVVLSGLAWLGMAVCAGAWVMARLGRPNPWFLGALAVAMGLTVAGVELSAMPKSLSNAAQLVIGVSLGVRFTPAFVHTAPRWLASVAVATLGLIAVCSVFAALLASVVGLPPGTMILAMAPGGVAEMAITAKVLQLGAPVVTAFHVCRLVAVLVLLEPLYLWMYGKPSPST
jgi:uncharacterized protein